MIELVLERRIAAERARVFEAWTEPELLRRWSAPEGLTIAGGDTDLRVGGGWRVVMVAPDGTRHEAFGTYRDVLPPRRLSYTHAWREPGGSSPETVLTIELEPDATAGATAGAPAGTRLRLTQTGFANEASRDGHAAGWSSALDQLRALLESPGSFSPTARDAR